MKTYCRLSYRIPFSETDAMAIVHHSNHPRYMERGRVELLRLADLSYASIMQLGFHFPLTDMQISYKKPLVFDDIILVETSVSQVTNIRLNFQYRIFTGTAAAESALTEEAYPGTPAVTGETFHCCVNNQGRPVSMSDAIREKILLLAGQ